MTLRESFPEVAAPPETTPQTPVREQAVKVLRNVLHLFQDPKRWTAGRTRRRRDDGKIAYCLAGAISMYSRNREIAAEAKQLVRENICLKKDGISIENFNDGYGREEVLATIREIIN